MTILRASMGLTMIAMAAVAMAIIVGCILTDPLPPHLPTACNETWCIFNTTPGETNWSDAQTRFMDKAGAEIQARRINMLLSEGEIIGIYPSVSENHVGRIYINYTLHHPIPIGWIIHQHHAPCGVSFYQRASGYMLTLRYHAALVNVYVGDEMFTPWSPIQDISIGDPWYAAAQQRSSCIDTVSSQVSNSAWRGFSFAIYRDG